MFTRDDRRFLRDMNIDPESTIQEDMFDAITAPGQYAPTTILVSAALARKVIAEFGELTFDTWWAYHRKHSA